MMWCEYELSTGERRWRWRISLTEPQPPPSSVPEWAKLGCSRCKGCPLARPDSEACPAASAVVDVVDALSQIASIDTVHVVVRLPEREVHKTTTGAAAARSVFGLLLATSGCPVLQTMRPLAKHHLPFASEDEFMFRLVGLHLLRAHLGEKQPPLKEQLQQLKDLNTAFAKRLRSAGGKDAGSNAIIQLFALTSEAGHDIDDGHASLKRFLA